MLNLLWYRRPHLLVTNLALKKGQDHRNLSLNLHIEASRYIFKLLKVSHNGSLLLRKVVWLLNFALYILKLFYPLTVDP
jgi:hypothetical protein